MTYVWLYLKLVSWQMNSFTTNLKNTKNNVVKKFEQASLNCTFHSLLANSKTNLVSRCNLHVFIEFKSCTFFIRNLLTVRAFWNTEFWSFLGHPKSKPQVSYIFGLFNPGFLQTGFL